MLSATAQAKNISCDIGVLQASEGGLMPMKEDIKIVTDGKDSDNCGSIDTLGHSLYLCVSEAAFVGGYDALLAVDLPTTQKGSGEEAYGQATLVTLRKNGRIDLLDEKSRFNDTMIKKLFDAGIDYEFGLGNDSALMDDSVSQAVKKGVLKKGDILLFSIRSCEEQK